MVTKVIGASSKPGRRKIADNADGQQPWMKHAGKLKHLRKRTSVSTNVLRRHSNRSIEKIGDDAEPTDQQRSYSRPLLQPIHQRKQKYTEHRVRHRSSQLVLPTPVQVEANHASGD